MIDYWVPFLSFLLTSPFPYSFLTLFLPFSLPLLFLTLSSLFSYSFLTLFLLFPHSFLFLPLSFISLSLYIGGTA